MYLLALTAAVDIGCSSFTTTTMQSMLPVGTLKLLKLELVNAACEAHLGFELESVTAAYQTHLECLIETSNIGFPIARI